MTVEAEIIGKPSLAQLEALDLKCFLQIWINSSNSWQKGIQPIEFKLHDSDPSIVNARLVAPKGNLLPTRTGI